MMPHDIQQVLNSQSLWLWIPGKDNKHIVQHWSPLWSRKSIEKQGLFLDVHLQTAAGSLIGHSDK